MILTKEEMKQAEALHPLDGQQLMEKAGTACADIIRTYPGSDHILVLCGSGNNAGDGFVIARQTGADVCLVSGKPRTPAAKSAFRQYSGMVFPLRDLAEILTEYTLIVDCVYGYGFHGKLPKKTAEAFALVEKSGIPVISVDINSGCEADGIAHDAHALHSELTIAVGALKPFHLFRKLHGMFREVTVADIGLSDPEDPLFTEMNREDFVNRFPQKAETAYKGSYGKTLLIGGSYGMAGALGLNITGAKCIGASYIEAILDESIYPVLAPAFLSTVFHPIHGGTEDEELERYIRQAAGIGFGSGAVHLSQKEHLLHTLLRKAECPLVIDAEGLRLLANNTFVLQYAKAKLILTPHIGEFCALENMPADQVLQDPLNAAKAFALQNRVVVVLKGPHTVVTDGVHCYVNQTGNAGLAQAGSGDLLTGIITALIPFVQDAYLSAVMGVWFHGYLADEAVKEHALQNLDLLVLREYAERFFKNI